MVWPPCPTATGRAGFYDRGALPGMVMSGVWVTVYPVSTQGRNPDIPKLERMAGFGVSSENSIFTGEQ